MPIQLDTTSEQNILNMLMDQSVISTEQMTKIKAMSKEIGKSRLETAFELNLTDEKKIIEILSKAYSLDTVDLKKYKINDKLKKIVPLDYIRNNTLVPFEMANGILKIAIPDASKLSLMKNLKTMTKMDPELYAATISDIGDFITRMSGGEDKLRQGQKLEQVKKKEKIVPIEVESDVINFGDKVIGEAIDMEASDIRDKELNELGFEAHDLKKLIKAVTSPQGMVLVTGPTGSGKTTTLYSILKHINKPSMNILTAEDPVEYELEGIGQVHVREDIGYTFASALRSFLRQDPEVILVGEIRDKDTVDIALKAALTGHLVFSTIHTNDAPSTITRLQNMGTPNYLISAALSLIMAQRLARKTCSECKIIDENATPKLLNSIGFLPEQSARAKIYKGKGCDHCNKSGYKGRMGVYEILEVTKELKQGILSNLGQNELEALAKKGGFKTMHSMGHDLLLSGDLSFAEYERILSRG